jgi:diguanylate cyclase (GGDEF)-like protein
MPAAVVALAAGAVVGPPASLVVRVVVQLLAMGVLLAGVARHREQPAPWIAFALAVAAWTSGDLLNALGQHDPAIAGWIVCYGLVYAGLALLTRPLLLGGEAAVWLDGVAGALTCAAIVVDPVMRALDRPSGEIVTNLSYPVCDVVLLGMVLGTFALTAWRPPPAWRWIGAGVVIMLAGDILYFTAWGTTDYRYGDGAWFEGAWALAFLAVAAAAWRPTTPGTQRGPALWGTSGIAPACTAIVTAALVADHWMDTSLLAVVLAGAALATLTVRGVLSMRELRLLALTRREALTDELTGLPNRRALLRELAELCALPEPRAALLLCDLDGFKEFNDTLGHEAGDELLREAADRIARAAGCDGRAARLGGDEFAVLVRDAGADEALALAARLRAELAAPLPVAGIEVRVDTSVGVAVVPLHSRSAPGLLRRADVAMYEAKGARTGVELYDAGRDVHSRERLVLAAELRAAVDAGELEVHFQPKVEVATGRVVGAEALVRWPHAERGLLFPDAFLPAAEQAGLMRPLTLAVLDRALAACGRWTAAGRELGVAVNLSASNLLDASLPDQVDRLLRRHGVAGTQLTLEVTEGVILANPRRSGEVLAAVRALGVAVSLDDFGTGHSSLSHVKRLPVDELKIDKAFVRDLTADPTDRAIVASIVRLAHSLGLTVTAEGVEDADALGVLHGEGCDECQGWLFSRALPDAAFTAWLDAREPAVPPRWAANALAVPSARRVSQRTADVAQRRRSGARWL